MTYSGELISELIEASERVSARWREDNAVRTYSDTATQLEARCALSEALGRLQSATKRLKAQTQCAHESLESRKGACDGGEPCREQTAIVIDGVPYCQKHAAEELRAQHKTQAAIRRESAEVRMSLEYLQGGGGL